jgi:hypothetical protein
MLFASMESLAPESSYFLLAAVDDFPNDDPGARPISPPEDEFG